MKRLFSLLLVFALLLVPAWATGGDSNIEGGGGETGSGTGTNRWFSGNDGIRVSIMQGRTAIKTFDLANKDWSGTVEWCFTIMDKLYYMRTQEASPNRDGYTNSIPQVTLPTIVPGSGGNSIDTIRDYFTDREVIEDIAAIASMDYEVLTNGSYKLMLEPIVYLEFNGKWWAMSATEAALYDIQLSGGLHSKMGSLTRQNLPLSMFLERSDLGITAWRSAPSDKAGATSGRQSNIDILNYLGVGIVSFFEEDLDVEDPPLAGIYDYTYHTDTEVITSVLISNTLGRDMDPDTRDYVTFQINGTTYRKQIVCPEGKHQLVWVKWHTPGTAQEMLITVTPPGGSDMLLSVSVVDLEEKTPPNPEYDGPGEGPGITGTQYRAGFTPPDAPDWGSNTSATWDQWITTRERYWEPNMVWVEDPEDPTVGDWEDQGEWVYYWDFAVATYQAGLRVDFELTPDARVPTAVRRAGKYIIGSGYGVDTVCEVRVSSGASTSDVTKAQHVMAVFPEFDYETYDRFLEPDRNAYSATWGFRSNPYSYYGEPVHFTPLWFPDGPYAVSVAVFDVWTPGGMLYASVSDSVTIDGDMYDDWYIRSY